MVRQRLMTRELANLEGEVCQGGQGEVKWESLIVSQHLAKPQSRVHESNARACAKSTMACQIVQPCKLMQSNAVVKCKRTKCRCHGNQFVGIQRKSMSSVLLQECNAHSATECIDAQAYKFTAFGRSINLVEV